MAAHTRPIRALPIAIVLLLSAAASSTFPEDDLVVVGVVADEAERPLMGAQVWIEGTSGGSLTDADGRYHIEIPRDQLPSDPVIVVQLIGYRGVRAPLDPPTDAAVNAIAIDFRLEQQAISLESIVTSGTDQPRRGNEGSSRVDATGAAAETSPPADILRRPVTATEMGRTRDRLARQRTVAPGTPVASVTNVGPTARPHHTPTGRPNGEQYARITENGFRPVRDHPLSTFSTDVDRASYSNIRRFLLRERRLPPVDAVQVEEMINYFSYDYATPEEADPVAITTELGAAPWEPEHRLLRIGVATRSLVPEELPASNLVFLIDVSGSMRADDKLPLVKRSLRMLVDQLRPMDRVAIVVYAGSAGLVLESTSGRSKDEILAAIERLEAGGSTAGGAGLRLAYRVARENLRRDGNNRVILATDGDFNVGESSDAAMVRLIEEKREEGTFLTVLGFGTGNLQSEKMQSLAQHGNGNYAYIDRLAEARKIFINEIGGTLVTVAQDVKLQIEFNPAHVAGYRLIGYENRLLANEDFNDDTKDAGDIGSGHRVTALYEIIPSGADSRAGAPGVDPLRYQTTRPLVRGHLDDEIALVRVRYKRPNSDRSRLIEQPVHLSDDRMSADFDFTAAVAGFGMLLRNSEHRGSTSVPQILELANEGMGPDLDGYRRGFIELVEAYRDLTTHTYPVR